MSVPSVRSNVRVVREPSPASSEPVATPEVAGEEVPRLPFRLRTVLLMGLLGGLAWQAQPRAEAAWKLNTSAANLANYALCMVGPTGPALLRDGSPQFRTLVRRRLVASEPTERPFADCAKLALDLTESSEVEQAHRAQAWSFSEYGGAATERVAAGSRAELGLDALGVSARGLGELARQAWPFVRGGYVKLVKPSIMAKEAVHPVEPPRPGTGRGLPAWRAGYRAVGHKDGSLMVAFGRAANLSVFQSSDRVTWRPAPIEAAAGFSERCPAGDRSYTLSLSTDAATLVVSFHGGDAASQSTPLGRADAELVSASCDERALVAALKREGSNETTLVHCAYRGACRPLSLPRFPGGRSATSYPLDIARAQGATIVALTMRGVVRVTSSRDDGRTWTPFVVAYDDGAFPDLRVDVRVPSRLLTIDKHVFLYGGAPKPGQSYSVLVSEDLGASFRTPDAPIQTALAK